MAHLKWDNKDIEIVRKGIFKCCIRYTNIYKDELWYVLTSELETQNPLLNEQNAPANGNTEKFRYQYSLKQSR